MALQLKAKSGVNPQPEFNQEELDNALNVINNFKYIIGWNEASPTITPDGSDHADKDTKFGITFPFNAKIIGVYLTLDTSVTKGNAANDYTLNLLNASTELLAADQSLGTVAAGTKTWIPADQNQTMLSGTTLKLRINQLDGSGASPTDISSAKIFAEVVYERI